MTDINGIFSVCEAVGTAAFAVSGAMVAVDKGTDIFGVLLMAVFTALGGGTLRDMLIGYFPPRMFTNFHYVLLACLCAIIVFAIARTFKERYVARERMIEQINNVFDAIGLGVFAFRRAHRHGGGFCRQHVSDHVPRHDHGHRRRHDSRRAAA